MIAVYGIKNCDTMKKAFTWLDGHGVAYDFYDYKKQGADGDVLAKAFDLYGWENVLNRKGMTWRKLDDAIKNNMDKKTAMALALENPSVIKRPLLVTDKGIYLGFDVPTYVDVFKAA